MANPNKLRGTQLLDFVPLGKKNKLSELQIIDLSEGEGQPVPEGATITAHYTGALCADGMIFESSRDLNRPATFGLDEVIKGRTVGVPGMKVGGIRRLLIPSDMAYGPRRISSAIGPNSDLVFDIELVAINN